MEKIRKVTIQDVARYANVSVGTIDRVIHNRGKVSPEKRKKVEEAIEKLNFNPNLLARTLALGNQFTVCILIPAAPSEGHYWSMPLNGLEMGSAQFKDYGIITQYFFYDLFDEKTFTQQTAKILEINPDGVILAPLFLNESKLFTEKLKDKEIPFVFIDADIPNRQSLSYIGPDVKQSAYIAGRLMNSILPEKAEILIVNMVKGFDNASALKRMEEGFRAYFKEHGQEQNKHITTLTIKSKQKDEVFRELTKYYIKNPAVKGVFVTNSKAYLVSEFHQNHDLDIRLLGYDLVEGNINHLKSGGIDVIISQSPVQQGQRAVQTLFEFFIQKQEPEKILHVPLDIIIRENMGFYIGFNRQHRTEIKTTTVNN
ncbi:transcriptional regulator, LacI family [Mariniphaga anaerophila]|uniref:Transcriptional regulator, LacI family n=1 Tax=Mariniphaga anaerophila TaxID=1484053 RepID=A0A1M5DDJ3_9BACT|nr:LacI family DNA-binding transcriptional regulator [Mariniphaga anaerophila]SHF64985.1 transcriptional regulator, LacI family [Mariniphaga anaerophila]